MAAFEVTAEAEKRRRVGRVDVGALVLVESEHGRADSN